jgi:hypothetical protein
MNLQTLSVLLQENDGSLPDINLNFHGSAVVAEVYSYLQDRATHFAAAKPCYWSVSRQQDVQIEYGDTPALEFLEGEAEPFHVVFSGVRAISGKEIPDLGVFILESDFVGIDYRMGNNWTVEALEGLFEILYDLSNLSTRMTVTHEGNINDPTGQIFEAVFKNWMEAYSASHSAVPLLVLPSEN